MIVVWTDEAAQSYIAQARSAGRPRPIRSSSDSRGIAGEDRVGRITRQPFRRGASPTRTGAPPGLTPSNQGAPMLSPIALALVGSLALQGARPDPQAARAPSSDSSSVRQWREDLAYLARELPRRHNNLFHTISRAQFDSALAVLDRKLPGLARHQVIVELARLVALVGDGHTNVAPTRDPKIGFHTYPVRLYFFKDGLFIRS